MKTLHTNKTKLLDCELPHFWEYEVNNFGGGNREQQMYVDEPEFARIEDGELIITAKRSVTNICGHTMPYASGRVRTKRRFDFRYGIVSFEAKLPEQNGLWPAVWMLPTESIYGHWPCSGEIDILEAKNADGEVSHAIHYGASLAQHQMQHKTLKLRDPSGWNQFKLCWSEGNLKWFVDGEETFNISIGNPFDTQFHLIINLAVGGQFPGREPDQHWVSSEFRVRNLEVQTQ